MAITDLTGTTWLINSTISEPQSTILAEINFTSNGENFRRIGIYDGYEPGTEQLINYTPIEDSPIFVYEYGWSNEAYRTIAITDGNDVTNSSLISWLEANATNVTPAAPPVIISYNNAVIATMDESGTKTLETEGKYCTDDILVEYTEPTLSLQNKTVSPTTASQSVTADSGYDGLGIVTVNAMPSGTAGTPTATKGTVSNHSVSVTPSVTNTTGYITGGTKTGTAVTVSASELVSGTKSITSSGTTDVTNYASASVAAGSAKTPTTFISAYPQISIDYADGSIEATVATAESVTPTVTAGYVSSGTAGTINVDGTQSELLPTKSAQTYTPTTTNQTIAQYQWLTGVQTILGDANLVAANIANGVTIFGVTGTHMGGTDVSDTTATASDVLSGKYFYTAAGVKTQGTIPVYAGALRGE